MINRFKYQYSWCVLLRISSGISSSIWYSESEDSTADWRAAREINLHSRPKRIVRLFRRHLSHFPCTCILYTYRNETVSAFSTAYIRLSIYVRPCLLVSVLSRYIYGVLFKSIKYSTWISTHNTVIKWNIV